MKTLQQAFDQVVAHLRAQGWQRSVSDIGGCAYRGEEGRKCAIDALIDDEAYSSDLEDLSVESACVQDALDASGWPREAYLYTYLQRFHDSDMNGADPAGNEAYLLRTARHFGLKYPRPA